MQNILQSASKLIILILTIVLSIAYLYSVLQGTIDIGDTFDKAVMLVFGFYFAYKGDKNQPYAGK